MTISRRKRRRYFAPIAALVLIFLIGAVVYALNAARLVSERMTELTFTVPSRIYAAPWSPVEGEVAEMKDFLTFFERSGFKEVRQGGIDRGQWRQVTSGFEAALPSFRDSLGAVPPRTVRVTIGGGRISRIEVLVDGRFESVPTVSLPPERLGEVYSGLRRSRTLIGLSDMPETMRSAILLMEDRSFDTHFGFSGRGALRALWRNFRRGALDEGGSTISQQLVKNFFLTPERTIRRKAREAVLTLALEVLYSKDRILEAYVNEIYLGQRGATEIRGFGEASLHYFAKEVGALDTGEQALLAGLIRSPGRYSPYSSPEAAEDRKRHVLHLMLDHGAIDRPTYEAALSRKLKPRGMGETGRRAPYFNDFIMSELKQRFPNWKPAESGDGIHTSLDPSLQILAEKAVRDTLRRLDSSERLEAALVALHPRTGAILAMVGGRDYSKSQFNRAVSIRRPVGSLIKPFVAAAAFEGGPAVATPETVVEDLPATFVVAGIEWAVKNYGDRYEGEVTVRRAIEKSLNVATVNLASRVGWDRLIRTIGAFGLDVTGAVPSIVLGAVGSSPLTVAGAYTALANKGLRSEPVGIRSVVRPDGTRLAEASIDVSRTVSSVTADLVTDVLRGVIDTGTASSVRAAGIKGDLSGKTGTSDALRDSWFTGYSSELLTTVWVGRDDNSPTGLTGASGALLVWIAFIKDVEERRR